MWLFKKISASLKDPYIEQKLAKKFLSFYFSSKNRYYYLRRGRMQRKAAAFLSNDSQFQECLSSLKKFFPFPASDFARIFSSEKTELITHAGNILENRYDILGSGLLTLSDFNWHTDFKSGYTWPKGKNYKKYRKVDIHNSADVKYPWELSRGHQYLILGQAYLLTGDEQYAKKFMQDITDWIAENPFMASINWTCTMEVSIRAANWIYALAMFRESQTITRNFFKKMLTSLWLHGCFIYRNPEKSVHNNHNHYISDLAGQIYTGLLFCEKAEASKWLKDGQYELFREIRYQILPSGPDYEKSVNYHRLVLELMSYTTIGLLKWNKHIPADILYRIEKMFEFVMYYLKPDGNAPVIGDQDDGRFLPFSVSANTDHRYLLSVGAAFFQREDFRYFSSGYNQECFFLLGQDKISFFNAANSGKVNLKSAAFRDAGFYIMRHEKDYLFINNSGKGRYSEIQSGTHTHSDLLSFELYCEDKSFIVDPGTYVYSADPVQRMKFRSTAMHNTVVIDGYDQNDLRSGNLWNFNGNAIPCLLQWKNEDDCDIFEGSHTGYMRLKQPVLHQRKIIYRPKEFWEITDCFEGEGYHDFTWYFHFDEGIRIKQDNALAVITESEGVNIRLELVHNDKAKMHISEDFVSKKYGDRKPASVLQYCIGDNCPMVISFKISKI